MALTKVTGHVVKPDTNIQFHNTKSTGIVTFAHTSNATSSTTGALQITGGVGIVKDLHVGGNVTVGGTLTYDDVTNIDSLGIVTARGGIHIGPVTAGVATVYTNGNASFTGIVTATTFVGALTGTASQVTIANGADNRVITAASANTLNGESTLTYDGTSTFELQPSSATPAIYVGDSNRTGAGQHLAEYRGNWNGTLVGRIVFAAGDDTTNKDDGIITMHTTPSGGSNEERLRITSDGKIGIGEDDPESNHLLIRGASTVGTKSGHIMLTGDGATTNEGPQIVFSESGSGANWVGGAIGFRRTGGNGVGDLVFGVRAVSGDANTTPTEALRILSNSNIRHVTTGANVSLTLSRNESVGTTNQALGVVDFASNTAHTVQARIMAKSLGTSNVGGDLVIETRADGGSLDERVRITGSGSLLINTTVATEAAGDFDNLIIGSTSNTHAGISIVGSTSGGVGSLVFTDGASYKNQGIIQYRHADNSMRFTVDQYEALRIFADGEVRVNATKGTNNVPAHLRLHCGDTSISYGQSVGQLRFAGRDAGGTDVSRTGALIQATAAANWDTTQSTGYSATHLDFFTQNNSGTDTVAAGLRLRISSTGNVLVGGHSAALSTYNPSQPRLSVYKSDGSGGYLELGGNIPNNGHSSGTILFINNNNSEATSNNANGKILAMQRAENVTSDTNAGDDMGADLMFSTKPEAGSLSEKLRINAAGGLKLSNTAGGNLFDYGGSTVNSNAAINIKRYGSGYADIRLTSNYGATLRLAGASDNTDEYLITQDNQKNAYHNLEYDGFINFNTNNTTQAMRLQGGKVGINKNIETLTGNGFGGKLQVNSGSNDYDGIMLGGGYNRSTISTGANYDLILTSNAYPANASSNGIRFKCGSSGGGGPNERMRLNQRGVLKVNQGVDTQGNSGGTFYAPNSSGYVGTHWTEQGAGFVFYMGELASGSSSNASAQYVTVYTSHHWGDYPRLIIWAHERYYRCSFTCWTFGAFGGSSPSYELNQTESWGGSNGGHGTDNAGSISVNHRGPVATYSGSPVHAYELTMSNTGNYGYTRWYVGVLKCGRGIYTSNSTASNVDATTTGGGCVHLKTISNSSMEPITYLTA